MKYGVFDTVDDCWVGESGPVDSKYFTGAEGPVKAYDDDVLTEKFPDVDDMNGKTLAQIAVQMMTETLGYKIGRLEVREFDCTPLVKKDEVNTIMTGEQAIRKIESGGI